MKKIIKKIILQITRIRYGTVIMGHHVYEENDFKDFNGVSKKMLYDYLLKNQKKIVSLDKILKKSILKFRKISITFDDGYKDIYNVVYPICKKLNIPFTIFIIVDKIDKEGFLSKEEIEEMIKSGLLTIGSHGYSHKILTDYNIDLKKEILSTKKYLEKAFDYKVDYFAFSHGQFNGKVLKEVKLANYKKSFSASYLSLSNRVIPRLNLVHFLKPSGNK